MRRSLLSLALWLALALPAAAGTVSIRLVEATDQRAGVDPGLEDVAAALRNSLVFKGYALLATASTSLPGTGSPVVLGPYEVRCTGPQNLVNIEVFHGHKRVLRTSVSLLGNSPVIVGGFAGKTGKIILVFMAR